MRKQLGFLWHRVRNAVRYDSRVQFIVAIAAITGIISLLVLWLVPGATDVQHFWGAVFASWLAGYVLFVLTGLTVALVTLSKPEHDMFELRIRNLVQKQEGAHVDYLVGRAKSLFEPYLEENTRDLHILQFDKDAGLFLVRQETTLVFRSFIPDIENSFPTRVGYRAAAQPPLKGEPARLVYLTVDGTEVCTDVPFDDNERLTYKFPIDVKPYSSCKVQHRMLYWVKIDDPNRQVVIRFTKRTKVNVYNDLPSQKLTVSYLMPTLQPLIVPAGKHEAVIDMNDLHPAKDETNDAVFDFRIAPC